MRRARIRAVANVPIRRKVEPKPEENTTSEPNTDEPKAENEPPTEQNIPEPPPISDTQPTESRFRRFKVQAKIPERKKPSETPIPEPVPPSTPTQSQVKILSITNIPPACSTPLSPLDNSPVALNSKPVQNINPPSSPLPNARTVPQSPTHFPELGISYPRPPASPCKLLNRPRIRSTPRLGHRRNSTSASESEDDSRRSFISKVRNDSISSQTSIQPTPELAKVENNVLNASLNPTTPSGPPPKKKARRSDIARKMAEARIEFHSKFGSKKPDRQKLTMMDLIFYNPTSNPMPIRPKKETTTKLDVTTEEAAIVEEEADEPDEEAMPVPQVKIGENGELILDEQSIVIETSESRKSKELTSTAINYDDLDTGYGIYKRYKKTKEWSHAETKQFYRVLQIIGTDFSLMLSYFKDRTRRDLKLKFKKEEKTNRALIDKILLNPKKFDLEELQKSLDKDKQIEEQREKELRKLKEEQEVKKPKSKKKSTKSSFFGRQILGESGVPERPSRPKIDYEDPKVVYSEIPAKPKTPPRRISYDTDDELIDYHENTIARMNQVFSVPTRSGRIPKPRKSLEPVAVESKPEAVKPVKTVKPAPVKTRSELEVELGLASAEFQTTKPLESETDIIAKNLMIGELSPEFLLMQEVQNGFAALNES